MNRPANGRAGPRMPDLGPPRRVLTMATSLLALLDDIASLLDDVSLMTKVAARKTAGVLGDDLALNAEQVRGVSAERELPVVWAVFKGSLVNKLILVPAALAISALAPWAITPLLMLGGLFLCYEGVEKVVHQLTHRGAAAETHAASAAAPGDLAATESDKIKGAVRTDFVLSAEIIVIALGTVESAPFASQVLVLCGVALLMTIGVYGLVAAIVKLDDAGLALTRYPDAAPAAAILHRLGAGLLTLAPWLMKFLSVAGTLAMFLVGGGILAHGIPAAHHWVQHASDLVASAPTIGGLLSALATPLLQMMIGALAGAAALLLVQPLHAWLARR